MVKAAERLSTVRTYQHFINRQWVEGGSHIPRQSPANGELVANFAKGTGDDALQAVSAARSAFDTGPWPRFTALERSRRLLHLGGLIRRDAEELARMEAEETGKPIRQARGDVKGAAELTEYAGALAQQLHGEVHTGLGDKRTAMLVREPVGVVGMIIPWNFPALIYAQKVPFALAAGCTTVVKPSEFTSSTALHMAQLAMEADIPDGVINVVTGYGNEVGQAIVDSPGVDRISFTGSTATGRRIMASASGTLKRLSLELGGKSANIVFADADLEDAVDGTLFGIYMNQGECCCSGTRLLIEESIADAFIERLVSAARRLRVGNPLDDSTDMGALIHPAHMHKVLSYIESGQQEGAKLVTGGHRLSGEEFDSGCFVAPTILDQVQPSMRVFQEEIFGPVLVIRRFRTVGDAIEMANNTSYGLANALWTKDLDKAMVVSRELKSGTVWVNTMIDGSPQLPFGGYGGSGFGREMGLVGLEEFTEVKTILIHLGKRDPYFASVVQQG